MLARRFASAMALVVLTVFAARRSECAELVVLAAPKCALDTKTVDPGGPRGRLKDAFDGAAARFETGDSVKGVKVTEETFVIELATTTAIPGAHTGQFKDATNKAVTITYKTASVRQPYKVWHVKGPGQKPVLIGESTATGFGSELKYVGQGLNEISKLTPAELAARGAADAFDDAIAERAVDFLAPKIVTTVPLRPAPLAVFLPTRVVGGKKDETVAELDLHNRLPLRASGLVRWSVGPNKLNLDVAIMAAGGKPPLNGPPAVAFDLAPGEKKTVSVTVPPEYAGRARTSEFSLSSVKLKGGG